VRVLNVSAQLESARGADAPEGRSSPSRAADLRGRRAGKNWCMEHTGVTPPVAISAPELANVATGLGPFLTVYLTTEANVANAAQPVRAHWKDLRRELAAQGADGNGPSPPSTPWFPTPTSRGGCWAVIARPAGVAHVVYEREPPVPATSVGGGRCPSLGPACWSGASPQPTHVVAAGRPQGRRPLSVQGRRPRTITSRWRVSGSTRSPRTSPVGGVAGSVSSAGPRTRGRRTPRRWRP